MFTYCVQGEECQAGAAASEAAERYAAARGGGAGEGQVSRLSLELGSWYSR